MQPGLQNLASWGQHLDGTPITKEQSGYSSNGRMPPSQGESGSSILPYPTKSKRICYTVDMAYKNKEQATACRRRYYEKNKEKYFKFSKERKLRMAGIIQEAKNVPCKDCGISYPSHVMDFDHLADKSFTISRFGRSVGEARLKEEMAKCEVVCANCHRQRTHNRGCNLTEE